jgi:uncharacterized protein (DUF2141 family)
MKIALLLASLAVAIAAPAVAAPVAAPSPAAERGSASLTVTFTGIELAQGRIMVALYDSSEAFGGGGRPVRIAPVAVAGTADVQTMFEGLAPGAYAVKAFHDVDGDGKLGSNPFGIPTEPFAFSNDAKGVRGPASWEAAAFAVAPGAASQRITLR